MTGLRVMTFNVRQLKDERAAVVAILRSVAPDVVALQEPPRGPFGGSRLRRLADEAGLVVVVAGGGARTTALLARPGLEVSAPRAMRLPSPPLRTRRGLATAQVGGLRVLSVHLGLSAAERSRQLVRILPVVASSPDCVVAGDLNEPPGGPAWRRLGQHLRDLTAGVGPTYPASAPRVRIDAVLGGRGVSSSGARVVGDEAARRASDHLPVVVDVSWS